MTATSPYRTACLWIARVFSTAGIVERDGLIPRGCATIPYHRTVYTAAIRATAKHDKRSSLRTRTTSLRAPGPGSRYHTPHRKLVTLAATSTCACASVQREIGRCVIIHVQRKKNTMGIVFLYKKKL